MTIPIVATAVLVVMAQATAPAVSDFAGRWMRVDASGLTDGWDVADEITVRPVVVDRTAAGAPMSPFVGQLQVERRTAVDVRGETITVGIRGGFVGGITARGQQLRSRSDHAVEWNGERLLMWSSTTHVDDDGTERVSERAQEWVIDADGQLVMALRTRAHGEDSRRGRLVYRRVP